MHRRTLLAALAQHGDATGRFGTELAWRDFHGEILARRRPTAAPEYQHP